jgi:hypothetical protein
VHPRQPDLEPPLGEVLGAALADAGYNDDEAILYVFDADTSAAGFEAFHFARDTYATVDDISEVAPLLADMNHDAARGAIRIVMFTGNRSDEGKVALIRHELEHARQTAELGPRLEGLYRLCADVLAVRAGGLPGGALVYTLMPIEMDANAAGARFAVVRYTEARIIELLRNGDRNGAALRSNVGPEPIATLPERMVAFMIANHGLCERYAAEHGNGTSFPEMLDLEWPGAGDIWRELVGQRRPRAPAVSRREAPRSGAQGSYLVERAESIRSCESCRTEISWPSFVRSTGRSSDGRGMSSRSAEETAASPDRSSISRPEPQPWKTRRKRRTGHRLMAWQKTAHSRMSSTTSSCWGRNRVTARTSVGMFSGA